MHKLISFFILAILFAVEGHTIDRNARKAMLDSLQGQLSIAMSASDSIKPLYGIFDLLYGPQRNEMACLLYNTAKQAHDTSAQLDMLRHLANINWNNDSLLQFAKKEIAGIQQSPEQKSTQLFIDMIGIDNLLWHERNGKHNEHLVDYVHRYSHDTPSDDYDRVLLLYAVCRYLGEETRGEMLENYMDRLDTLVGSLNLPDGSVRRLIYNRASPVYYENGNYPRVLELDKKLLHEIDSLEISYNDKGRIYYNAPIHRYKSYRRMLGCYPILSEDEIKDYYGRVLALSDMNPNIDFDLRKNERASIYYAMATGDFTNAKTMLKRQINEPNHERIRLPMLRMLQEAAEKTGDDDTLLDVTQLLNEELDKQLETKRLERSRELQLIYDLSDLQQRNSQLEQSNHMTAIRARTVVIFIGAAAFVILAIFAALLFRQNRRNRKLAANLKLSNDSLRDERDGLRAAQQQLTELRDQARTADRRKTEFVNHMSHEVKVPLAAIAEYAQLISDCIPENQRAYLDRFAAIINKNVRIIMRLVNDVLDTDSIDNGQLSLEVRPTPINDICHMAIDNVFECGIPDKEGLKFIFRPECDDETTVETDGQRVSQVLVNLLTNAVKFSEKGVIDMTYHYDHEAEKLTFTVTDQGRGIPDGQEEAIFERFRRLDHSASGCGLGLNISRSIARLLGGSLKVDTTYKAGARFLFTIPANSQK